MQNEEEIAHKLSKVQPFFDLIRNRQKRLAKYTIKDFQLLLMEIRSNLLIVE